MSTQIPIPAPADGTLTATPHVVAVVVAAVTTFITTKLHLDTATTAWVAGGTATALTTLVHWLQAKLAE
jgi:hypothetical protein